ncbi:MAG: aminopeptidase P family protein [Lachnospiraceae bacterium]|nr:aminopeptidase P family protein [Lachnospiraceae bacterium]
MIQERLQQLRALMKREGMAAYMILTEDFHGSEYVGAYFKCRKFMSGFTGSAGTLVVCEDMAGLWTDGRYFLQAEEQLAGSTITLYKSGEEGVPTIREFLKEKLPQGAVLGFDGRAVNTKMAHLLEKTLAEKEVRFAFEKDLVGEIWENRPALSAEPVMLLTEKYTGKSRADKLALLREKLAEKKGDYFVLSSLDDIAWLLNIRGNDVICNPVVLSYLAMTADETVLFINEKTMSEEVKAALAADGVVFKPYNDIYAYMKQIPAGKTVVLDEGKTNYAVISSVGAEVKVQNETNLTLLPKAIKNETEVENERQAHIKDGVAVTKLMYWLKHNVGKQEITELSVADKLEEFHQEQENYMGPSFEPIIGYAEHGAIIHYSATEESSVALKPEGLVLMDTGGQYLEGTTDITRTVALGPVTEEEKKCFTLVLRGNLNLGAAKFKYGCCGANLDYLARFPMWEEGLDYNHGTGHGVGYFLNVHEGPNNFGWKVTDGGRNQTVFEEGMITSNEPGLYFEGKFGIRLENMIVCKKAEKTEYGQFMCFETLTMVPFDLDVVDAALLSVREKQLLNNYHKQVYETIAPRLTAEEAAWLKEATREI